MCVDKKKAPRIFWKLSNLVKKRKKTYLVYLLIDRSGIRNLVFGFRKCHGKIWVLKKASWWRKAFLPSVRSNFEKSSNMAINEEKPCLFNLPYSHFLADSGYVS